MANENLTPNTPVPAPQSGAMRTPAASGMGTSGKTVIADGVIAKVASIAAREVPGVYALGGGAERIFGAVRDAMGNTDHGQGVSVEVGETQVAADLTIVANYPVPLQKVADDVRAAVYKVIQELVGMEVTEVNVTISDVHTGEDDNKDSGEDSGKGARVQ